MKIKLLLICLIACFNTSVTIAQSYEIKYIIDEINEVRKCPSDYSRRYKVDLSEYYKTKQLKYDKKLSLECQKYAEYLGKNNLFEHDRSIDCGESLSRVFIGYRFVVWALIKEINFDGDGHRRHLTGNAEYFKDDKIIGVGLYVTSETTYCVIRTK